MAFLVGVMTCHWVPDTPTRCVQWFSAAIWTAATAATAALNHWTHRPPPFVTKAVPSSQGEGKSHALMRCMAGS